MHLCRGEVNHFLCRKIALVTDKELVNVLASIAVNLLEPLLYIGERFLERHARYK